MSTTWCGGQRRLVPKQCGTDKRAGTEARRRETQGHHRPLDVTRAWRGGSLEGESPGPAGSPRTGAAVQSARFMRTWVSHKLTVPNFREPMLKEATVQNAMCHTRGGLSDDRTALSTKR